tara:strand:+ start:1386 stop:1646 length:261 start_codon:yes stop_codon:yes gene_type:complete
MINTALTPPTTLATSKRQINRYIRHHGVEIQNNRDGYSYFTALADTDRWIAGQQIGESVYICWLSQVSVAYWVSEAVSAVGHGPRD